MKYFLMAALSFSLVGCATTVERPTIESRGAVMPRPEKAAYTLTPAKGGAFSWPVKGSVASFFGAKFDRSKNRGIDILCPEGTTVAAARSGRVVFSDDKLRGLGKTVILEHGDGYQTVYAYNSSISARVGDEVAQNSAIARSGRSGRAKEPCLHFEIRKDGEPINPLSLLH